VEHSSPNEKPAPVPNGSDYRPTLRDFYNLMKFKVTKILLVSSLYDAFILEEDGLLVEQISDEYRDLSLSSPPQVVRVPSGAEALKELRQGRYDLIVTMSQIMDLDPREFCRQARAVQTGIPVVLLATVIEDLSILAGSDERKDIDKVFYWTGDSALFLAITKYVEDRINVAADTAHGMVKALLVIEDSPMDYSTFLPTLYTEIMRQTQALIAEGLNEQEKWFRKKARPKILLAETFEEAEALYHKYRDSLLGLITDVAYPRGGKVRETAGFEFIEEVVDADIPVLVQSSHPEHKVKADQLGRSFLDKHSEALVQGIADFLKQHLGFGDFVFLMPDGTEVDRVSDIREFVEAIQNVTLESIRYHGLRNDFSRWLMARGEITLAGELRPKTVSDFTDDAAVKEYLVAAIRKARQEKRLGMITDFAQETLEFEEIFTRLGSGSLGGKGRGLAFLAVLLQRSAARREFAECRVRLPDTLTVGTDVFDRFMADNDLYDWLGKELPDDALTRRFAEARLPEDIRESLARFLSHIREPLAVRSSSLLEDSQSQPFAGVYSTYMLPNNSPDAGLRLDQLCQAIKLVYASTFSERAMAYVQSVLPGAEEKMAVVIQKLVGRSYGDRFYPIFSGVGQSCNFYPVSPLTRDDGMVSVALGLGKIVVEGSNVLSFSPARPDILPGLSSPKETVENTQRWFYALDLSKREFDLLEGEGSTLKRLEIADAAGDGTLEYVASTYDANDDMLRDDLGRPGIRVITFAGIRKFNMLPLVHIIDEILATGERGMGRPVEIEFAGTIARDGTPEFYVLQIRPLVTLRERQHVVIEAADMERALVSTDSALGNGVLEGIRDVVLVPPGAFDPTKTVEIAAEVGDLNRQLQGTPYILVGPGRWGTQDRFAGIPVEWHQISWARTVIETSFEGFHAAPSYGTHFYHNITSLGILYLTVHHDTQTARMRWDALDEIPPAAAGTYVKHIKLPSPVIVKVDGRTGRGVILEDSPPIKAAR
jgi:CheY-like chemotaxis protein